MQALTGGDPSLAAAAYALPRGHHHPLESYQRLSRQYDVILAEGAGSPAEINLRAHDIANMGFAEAVDCPVVLVADIDRGGANGTVVGVRWSLDGYYTK